MSYFWHSAGHMQSLLAINTWPTNGIFLMLFKVIKFIFLFTLYWIVFNKECKSKLSVELFVTIYIIGLSAKIFFGRYHLGSKHSIKKNLIFQQKLWLKEPAQEYTDTLATVIRSKWIIMSFFSGLGVLCFLPEPMKRWQANLLTYK